MKKFNRLFLIFYTIFSIFIMVSCSSKSENISTNTTKDKDQFLNSYLETEPATLDESNSTDSYGAVVLQNTGETLTRLEENEDGTVEIKPAGAEKWDILEDGLVYIFYLRDNCWSDGKPVTAQDYAYSIKRTCDPKTGSPNAKLLSELFKNGAEVFSGKLPVDKIGIEVINDKTIKFILSRPINYFLDYTYSIQFIPQREDIVKKFSDKYGSEANTVISSGPFVVDSWSHRNEINLIKNPYYWDKDKVILEKVNFKIMDDEGARHNSMANGSIDYLDVTMYKWRENFSKNSNMSLIEYPRPHVGYGFFNTKDPLFKNINIRKAFIVSLDREEIAKAVWDSSVLPGEGWISPAIKIGEKNYRKEVGSVIKRTIKDNPDPKKLLLKGMEELGLGNDPSNITVKLSIGGTEQSFRILAEYLQQKWMEKLGVKVIPEFNEWSLFLSNVYSGNFQIGQMGNIETINDPAGPMENHLSTSGSVKNFWQNQEYDNLYWKAAMEKDINKRIDMYKKLEDMIIYDEAVVNPISHLVTYKYRYNYVYNLPRLPFVTTGLKYVYTSGR